MESDKSERIQRILDDIDRLNLGYSLREDYLKDWLFDSLYFGSGNVMIENRQAFSSWAKANLMTLIAKLFYEKYGFDNVFTNAFSCIAFQAYRILESEGIGMVHDTSLPKPLRIPHAFNFVSTHSLSEIEKSVRFLVDAGFRW